MRAATAEAAKCSDDSEEKAAAETANEEVADHPRARTRDAEAAAAAAVVVVATAAAASWELEEETLSGREFSPPRASNPGAARSVAREGATLVSSATWIWI